MTGLLCFIVIQISHKHQHLVKLWRSSSRTTMVRPTTCSNLDIWASPSLCSGWQLLTAKMSSHTKYPCSFLRSSSSFFCSASGRVSQSFPRRRYAFQLSHLQCRNNDEQRCRTLLIATDVSHQVSEFPPYMTCADVLHLFAYVLRYHAADGQGLTGLFCARCSWLARAAGCLADDTRVLVWSVHFHSTQGDIMLYHR